MAEGELLKAPTGKLRFLVLLTSGDHELLGVFAPEPGDLDPSILEEGVGPRSPTMARILGIRL